MVKYKKTILILLLIILVIMLLSTTAFANVIDTENYKPEGLTKKEANKIVNKASKVLATIRNCGAVISVITLSIIGLKYMICSVEEKANYKESMIPYVVGCLLLTMATTIPSLVYDILN